MLSIMFDVWVMCNVFRVLLHIILTIMFPYVSPLYIVSYSDRSPIDGLAEMNFVISKTGTADDESTDFRLPSAHTCFNHMLLPPYSTIDVLRTKLKYAMSHSEGFGLR